MASFSTTAARARTVACIQLDSKHANVAANIETVLKMSRQLTSPIDLLVLPELALTGYVFKDKDEINPLLEDTTNFFPPSSAASSDTLPTWPSDSFISECRKSCASSNRPSLTLAAHLAQQLRCYVVIGFPELCPQSASSDIALRSAESLGSPFDARPADVRTKAMAEDTTIKPESSGPRAYNSAALLAPDGTLQHVFRKHFLFETDEVWASEGAGFEIVRLPNLGNVCVAICMDLNPYQFRTSFEAYELASFCIERDVDLLVMPMAWLASGDQPEGQQVKEASTAASSLSTINYWAMRCRPFFAEPSSISPTPRQSGISEPKARFLITANRTGTETTSTFAGSSCVLEMNFGERPVLLQSLGSTQEGCMVVELPA